MSPHLVFLGFVWVSVFALFSLLVSLWDSLRLSWALLVSFWGSLGLSWSLLGLSCASLGLSGALLGLSLALLRHFWLPLGLPWASLGLSWAALGQLLASLRLLLGLPFWAPGAKRQQDNNKVPQGRPKMPKKVPKPTQPNLAKSLGFFNKIGSRSLSETGFLEVFLLYGPAEKPS